MKRLSLLAATSLSLVGTSLAVPGAAIAAGVTAPVHINFASDTAGAKPNGFQSADSPAVSFHDTSGADLAVQDFGVQSNGQALAVLGDDGSALEIRMDAPVTTMRLAFGNDDPGFTDPGDEARLTLFRGGNQVGQVAVVLNRDDEMNQRITKRPGALFNRAVFQYTDQNGNPINLIEIVDDIRTSPQCTVAGSQGNDILTGTAGQDVLCGAGRADALSGLGGNDLVLGGHGQDRVKGGRGLDTVVGGPGNDAVVGNDGADRLSGSDGRDRVKGGRGPDRLDGGPGRDRCDGDAGRDRARHCETRVNIP